MNEIKGNVDLTTLFDEIDKFESIKGRKPNVLFMNLETLLNIESNYKFIVLREKEYDLLGFIMRIKGVRVLIAEELNYRAFVASYKDYLNEDGYMKGEDE